MPPKQAPAGSAKFVKSSDAVADDRNWVGRIQNELNCTTMWDKDWGFLAGGAENISIDKATVNYTIDDKIKMIEEVFFIDKFLLNIILGNKKNQFK